ncbi:DUF2142 domain-containing protein [Enterococcus sp. 22-H-5-01]|uniref:DUF2142 domain-containing protein n=1 Tax=Enterococcus sp. 22-H-5-01 TaxID=3418555 RepID=UPI003D09546C
MNRLLKNVVELKKNYLLLAFGIIIMLVSQFSLQYRAALWPKLYMLIALIAGILTLSFSRLSNPKKIARNAFVMIVFLGIANALILPVRQNLDENTHYYHALQVSDGKIRNQVDEKNFLMVSPDFLAITKLPSKPGYGSKINTNLYNKDFLALKNLPSEYKSEYVHVEGFNNPAYIPSALGIKFGQLISGKLAVSYYMGRIFNLIFYAILVFLAIKISKNYKIQLFAFGTLPYTLWITAGYSYDSSYYGLVLLVIAQFANFIDRTSSITMKKMIFYCFTCFLLVFCKAPMVLLAVLPLFLPKRFFKNIKTYISSFFAIGFSGVLGILWIGQNTLLTRLGLITKRAAEANMADADTISRLSYFINHPIYTLEVVLRSLSDVLATIMGSIQNPQPFLMKSETLSFINIVVFLFLLIVISLLFHSIVPKTAYLGILGIFSVVTLAVFYAISGDDRVFKLGDLNVSGVQGRYHFYILTMVPMFLSPVLNKVFKTFDGETLALNEEKLVLLIFKLVFITTWINTCVALFGYL